MCSTRHLVVSMTPTTPSSLESAEPAFAQRVVWPRAIMAALLLLILTLTVHLVDLSWFGTEPPPATLARSSVAQSGGGR